MTNLAISRDVVLHAANVSHRFGSTPALDRVSLAVHRGETVAVVGPSGCGKTTLLRACAALLAPTEGQATAGDSRVGFVFQEPALLAWRRVDANARLFAADDDGVLVERLLATAGLASEHRKWHHELSGGMKMRLSLVRTLAARPSLLLCDEPFWSLDQITRHRLHDEFAALQREHGFAALLVTHAVDEAVYLADRVLVMSRAPGRIVAEVAVPFEHPRRADLRWQPDFAALCGRVAGALAGSA